MRKQKIVHLPIYHGAIKMIVTDTFEEEAGKAGVHLAPDSYDGVVFEADTTNFVLIMKPDFSIKAMVHESGHLVHKIFKLHGVQLSYDNDEAECYLLEWIFNEIHKFHNSLKPAA